MTVVDTSEHIEKLEIEFKKHKRNFARKIRKSLAQRMEYYLGYEPFGKVYEACVDVTKALSGGTPGVVGNEANDLLIAAEQDPVKFGDILAGRLPIAKAITATGLDLYSDLRDWNVLDHCLSLEKLSYLYSENGRDWIVTRYSKTIANAVEAFAVGYDIDAGSSFGIPSSERRVVLVQLGKEHRSPDASCRYCGKKATHSVWSFSSGLSYACNKDADEARAISDFTVVKFL